MRRRLVTLAAAVALAMGAMFGVASAIPEHPHALVLHVEYEGEEPVGFARCIELANGRALRLNAHHDHAHTGRAGEALFSADHAVVPLAPVSPFRDCDDIHAFVYS